MTVRAQAERPLGLSRGGRREAILDDRATMVDSLRGAYSSSSSSSSTSSSPSDEDGDAGGGGMRTRREEDAGWAATRWGGRSRDIRERSAADGSTVMGADDRSMAGEAEAMGAAAAGGGDWKVIVLNISLSSSRPLRRARPSVADMTGAMDSTSSAASPASSRRHFCRRAHCCSWVKLCSKTEAGRGGGVGRGEWRVGLAARCAWRRESSALARREAMGRTTMGSVVGSRSLAARPLRRCRSGEDCRRAAAAQRTCGSAPPQTVQTQEGSGGVAKGSQGRRGMRSCRGQRRR